MLQLIIDREFENIGETRDFLYEIGHLLNKGMKTGEGWELAESSSEEEDGVEGPTSDDAGADGETLGKEVPNDSGASVEANTPLPEKETEPRTPDQQTDQPLAPVKTDKKGPMPWEKNKKK